MIVIGADVHKSAHALAAVDAATGQLIAEQDPHGGDALPQAPPRPPLPPAAAPTISSDDRAIGDARASTSAPMRCLT
jgi:hypothetical protein